MFTWDCLWFHLISCHTQPIQVCAGDWIGFAPRENLARGQQYQVLVFQPGQGKDLLSFRDEDATARVTIRFIIEETEMMARELDIVAANH